MIKTGIYRDENTEIRIPEELEPEKVAGQVCNAVIDREIPGDEEFSFAVDITLTDNDGIRFYNREYREIDAPTDVLSFPNMNFGVPGDFSSVEEDPVEYTDPETGEILLGDMIISMDRVISQAEEYGHGIIREFAFLVAHSMLHLLGYDHMEPEEAQVMEKLQEEILCSLDITRD